MADPRVPIQESGTVRRRLRRRFWLFVVLAIFFLGPALFPRPEWSDWEHARQILLALLWSVAAAYEVGRAKEAPDA